MHKTFFKSDILPQKKAKKPWRPGPRKATGERAVFEFVWLSRPHNCEICGAAIRTARPECFAHKFGKGTHRGERLNPLNVSLVCGLSCHAKVDAKRRTERWPDIKKICKQE